MEETITEEIKEINPLAKAIQDLYDENTELKIELETLKLNNERLLLRERCYQSELGKVKTLLSKVSQSILTTPHTHDAEYQRYIEELVA